MQLFTSSLKSTFSSCRAGCYNEKPAALAGLSLSWVAASKKVKPVLLTQRAGLLWFFFLLPFTSLGQLFSNGFETAGGFVYSATSAETSNNQNNSPFGRLNVTTTGGEVTARTGSWVGYVQATGSNTKTYDASIITATDVLFRPGYTYTISVYARIGVRQNASLTPGALTILTTDQTTNAGIRSAVTSSSANTVVRLGTLSATGFPTTTNVTTTAYTLYTTQFTVATQISRRVAFQLFSNTATGNGAPYLSIDDVTVTEACSPASLSAFNPVCDNTAAFALSGGAPAGGTYAVNGTTTTTFDPVARDAGNYTITYTSPCGSTSSQTLTVIALPTLSALSPICEGNSLTLSAGTPAGGSYSGLGVTSITNPSGTTYAFNAAGTLAPGDYTITYSTGCGSASQTITIIPKPSFSQSFKAVCAGTTLDLAPYASPTGGTFSGQGVSPAGVFNPGGLTGTGPFTITYTTSCGSATIDLNVTGTSDWTGAVSNDWSDARNWSNCVPSTTIGAFIPASASNNYPVITPGTTVDVRSLVVAGTWLPTSGNINLHGDLIISGSGRFVHTGGTVKLMGNSQIVGVATFNNLIVATTGTTALNGNIAVTGTLTMQSGVINTGDLNGSADFRIDLGTTGNLIETEDSYVYARVRAERPLPASGTQNFGGIGLSLALTSGTSPGTIVVNRISGTVGAIQTGEGTSQSIERYFDVVAVPATTAPFTLSGTLNYRQAELNGIPENNLRAFRSADGGIPWTPLPSVANPTANQVAFTNLTALGRLTLGDRANPLPITLVAFEAKGSNQAVRLTWSTAMEKNNRGFGVEVAAQGPVNFQELAFVPSEGGNSTTLQSYAYTDATPRAAGTYFYRLRQVDMDGTTAYSPVRAVTISQAASSAKAYPNPFSNSFLVELPAQLRQQAITLVLHDALGREVYRAAMAADTTSSGLLTISPNTRTPGVYMLSILSGNLPAQRIRLVQE